MLRAILNWWAKLFKLDPGNAITALVFVFLIALGSGTLLLRVIRPRKNLIINSFEITALDGSRLSTSGRAVSEFLADEAKDLVDESTSYMSGLAKEDVEKPTSLVADSLSESINVGVELGGFSIERIESEWKKVRYEERTISGNLLILSDGVKLRVRNGDHLSEVGPFPPTETDLKGALRQVGMEMLAECYPLIGGALYQKQGQIDKAIHVYEQWTRQRDLSRREASRAYFYLGVAWHLKQNPEESIKAFANALRFDPKFHQAAANRAYEYFQHGEPDNAITSYELAIALKKDNPATWLNYGNCLMEKHRYSEAITAYRAAEKLAPDDRMVKSNLATAIERDRNP